jgi:hypothetical protein
MSIIFLPRIDGEKRKNGWRASGASIGGRSLKPVPPNFIEKATELNGSVGRLRTQYSARETTIRRWAEEVGVDLKALAAAFHQERWAARTRPPREFDPTLDNALLRQAISAMVGRTS